MSEDASCLPRITLAVRFECSRRTRGCTTVSAVSSSTTARRSSRSKIALVRENAWSRAHARRVIDEYRRFVLLAMVAGHPVTPSDAVDQVWHLHLTYTRSYWDRLCGEALGRPLHHGPTRGGRQESEKFTDWYQRTLAKYREVFGEEPPHDIWPPISQRFGEEHIARIDRRQYFVIRRPNRVALGKTATIAASSALALGGAGCARALGSTNAVAPLMIGVGVVAAIGLLIWFAMRSGGAKRSAASHARSDGSPAWWWFGWGGDGVASTAHPKHRDECNIEVSDGISSGDGSPAASGCGSVGDGGGASGCGASGCGGGGCGGGGCGS